MKLKTINELSDVHVNMIYSIIIGKRRKAIKIMRNYDEYTKKCNFIMAIFKIDISEEKWEKETFDTLEMGICILEDLSIRYNWWYKKGNSTAVDAQSLYNHHKITKYLMKRNFNV